MSSKEVQIKPLLYYNISLMFQQDLCLLAKQRKNTIRKLRLADDTNGRIPDVRRKTLLNLTQKISKFIKLLKPLKLVSSANLKDSTDLTTARIKQTALLCVVKKMYRVRNISIRNGHQATSPLNLGIWLRYTQRLKRIGLVSLGLDYDQIYKIENKIRRLFILMNRLKITSLNLEEGYIDGIEPYFAFQHYPSSLEKLTICSHTSPLSEEATILKESYINSLADLTQLKILRFAIPHARGVMTHLLNSISNLSHLEALDLRLKDYGESTLSQLSPFLSNLTNSKQLKSFRIYSAFPYEIYTELFQAIKGCALTDLSIQSYSNNNTEREQLFPFLLRQEHLEDLCLGIKNFKEKNSNQDPAQWAKDILFGIQKVLAKPIRLRSFILLNYDNIEELNILDVIDSLRDTAPFLKILRIHLKQYRLSELEFSKILNFLNKLKEIEVLQLNIEISGEECFEELVIWCEHTKNLRVLEINGVKDIKSREMFVGLVKRVLSKRGLENFSCATPIGMTSNMYQENGTMPHLDMKVMRRKNPFLERYPTR